MPSEDAASTALYSPSVMGRGRASSGGFDVRGNALLPKVLLVIGAAAAVYLVFSILISLLITLLMIVGGVALLYAVFRIGRWQGHRDMKGADPSAISRGRM